MKENNKWKEVKERKDEFQTMVQILVDYDDRTGRFMKQEDPYTHHLRKSITICRQEEMRIFVRNLKGFRYQVVVEINGPCGFVVTSWLHDDGIMVERLERKEDPCHPVHRIICLTDFLENATDISEDLHSITIDVISSMDYCLKPEKDKKETAS